MGSIAKASDLAARIENESRYWSGYDPALIAALSKEMSGIETEFNNYKEEYTREKHKTRRYVSVTATVLVCIIAFAGVIGFFASKYNKAYEAAVRDVGNNFTEEDFKRLGYTKYTGPDNHIILVKDAVTY